MRDIHIKKAMNGFIVTVGCQTLVFEGRERLIRELDLYLEHPDKADALSYAFACARDLGYYG